MELSARSVLERLTLYLDCQTGVGTLRELQRAVLRKGDRALEKDGHWPIVDFPLAIHKALGSDPGPAEAVAGSCALFYAFADITDDAQDHALGPEPWETWGWEQAVNTGTSLLFLSLQHLFDRLEPALAGRLASIFVRAGNEMTLGQHDDLIGQTAEPALARYLLLIERKSGASFGAYAEAMAAASGSIMASEFRDFGRNLGMIFQMMNDTYELWSNRLSPDLVNGRLSLPIILALEQLEGEQKRRLQALLRPSADLECQRQLVGFLEESGIKAYATLRIEVYKRRAKQLAQRLGIERDPYLACLLDLPAFPQANMAV